MKVYVYYDIEEIANTIELPKNVTTHIEDNILKFIYKNECIVEFTYNGEIRYKKPKPETNQRELANTAILLGKISIILANLDLHIFSKEDENVSSILEKKNDGFINFTKESEFLEFYNKEKTLDDKINFLLDCFNQIYIKVPFLSKQNIHNSLLGSIIDRWSKNKSNTDNWNPFYKKNRKVH